MPRADSPLLDHQQAPKEDPLPTSVNSRVASLYDRLNGIGLKPKYVRDRLLPSWWDDEGASTPAGFAQLAMLLARRVSLPVAALLDKDADLSYVAGENVKFKMATGTDPAKLALTQHLVTQVARAAVAGMGTAARRVPSAADLRSAILEKSCSNLGFGELLEYCWGDLGIPVLPISTFPPGSVKMDGLATNIDGRPVVVISKNAHPAWLLFVLAHEIGHVGSGHVGANQTLVDSDVEKAEADAEEDEANAYAVLLLRGPRAKTVSRRLMNAETLLGHANELGRTQSIDPGHLILSYAREKNSKAKDRGNFWPVANRALGLLRSNSDGLQLMRDKLSRHLDWSAFSDDVAEYIRRMTGPDPV